VVDNIVFGVSFPVHIGLLVLFWLQKVLSKYRRLNPALPLPCGLNVTPNQNFLHLPTWSNRFFLYKTYLKLQRALNAFFFFLIFQYSILEFCHLTYQTCPIFLIRKDMSVLVTYTGRMTRLIPDYSSHMVLF